jgi:hypothetical protein
MNTKPFDANIQLKHKGKEIEKCWIFEINSFLKKMGIFCYIGK